MATTTQTKKRPPQKKGNGRNGRPAGLFTWLAVGLVVIVVAALVIIKVASGGTTSGGGSHAFQPADPTVVQEVTHVPLSVFNTVGITSSAVGVVAPQAISPKQPVLYGKSSTGAKVPSILYVGAEYCPYCAAQRWATIAALGRFGTFTGLGNMASYSGDVYPNTPTFTFAKATYKSKYINFQSVEEYADYLNAAKTSYEPLQTPTKAQAALFKKYDSSKYVNGLAADQDESYPFITFADQYLVVGASYSPTTLAGQSRTSIAAGLSNASSPITDAIIASANYQTAAICAITKEQPSNVCTSAGVKAADASMKLKS